MAHFRTFAPAFVRRAFCFSVAAASALCAAPAPKPAPLAQLGKPDAAEVARILAQFQQMGIAGQYYLSFELHALPRRGDEQVFRGQLWGGHNALGAIERISVLDGTGHEHRWLVQHGERGALWRWADGRVDALAVAASFEPLVPGVEVTAFDLQMPFLFWPGATCDNIARMRGRPAYQFVFRPSAELAAQHRELSSVRAYFDTQFNAPVAIEYVNDTSAVAKTLSLVDLKKVGEQWLMKSLDVRDEATRNKTRLLFTGAALNLQLAPSAFTPAGLATPLAAPVADAITSLE